MWLGSRSFSATRNPAAARLRATCWPKGEPAPTMSATLASIMKIPGFHRGFALAQGDLVGIFAVVERQIEIRAGVIGVADIQFVEELSVAIILDDGEVQMQASGIARVAGEITHIAEEGAGFYILFKGALREFFGDVALSVLVSQVGVIGPDLTAGVQWVAGDADNDRSFPIRQAGEIAGVRGVNRGHAGLGARKDVEAGMVVAETVGLVPQTEDNPARREGN